MTEAEIDAAVLEMAHRSDREIAQALGIETTRVRQIIRNRDRGFAVDDGQSP